MKFPVLWSGLCCYTVKCSEILAHIKLLYNPRVNKVFTSLHNIGYFLVTLCFCFKKVLVQSLACVNELDEFE